MTKTRTQTAREQTPDQTRAVRALHRAFTRPAPRYRAHNTRTRYPHIELTDTKTGRTITLTEGTPAAALAVHPAQFTAEAWKAATRPGYTFTGNGLEIRTPDGQTWNPYRHT
ncbi:hypothetical protein IHN63_00730 [Deinococcus sp. 6YEL10]|uniref:hypothetical protein n=1 Tax=Deinococcus sp. 6YEL10 TaxID=2745870 RepID=UPI001E50BA65|nr:hypothetical protein [Deinococcus sp. 6YEL10]MCD0159822.1 hypothetical protein [Deinococcus sp. 6YEL10]